MINNKIGAMSCVLTKPIKAIHIFEYINIRRQRNNDRPDISKVINNIILILVEKKGEKIK